MIQLAKWYTPNWDPILLLLDNPLIREINRCWFERRILNSLQQIMNAIKLSMSFRSRLDDCPGLAFCVSVGQHVVFCSRVGVPLVKGIDVGLWKLPTLVGCVVSGSKTVHLLIWVNWEPIFNQDDSWSLEETLENGYRTKKLLILFFSAEPHYLFNTCSIVPAPIKEHHFSTWW